MTRFAIDARTLIEVAADERAVDASHQLVAPNAIRSRALDLLLLSVGHGELTEQQALALHERLTTQKLRLLGDRVSRRTAWKIARDRQATIAEAEYVAIAELQADAFITRDPQMMELAAGIVTLTSVDALFS